MKIVRNRVVGGLGRRPARSFHLRPRSSGAGVHVSRRHATQAATDFCRACWITLSRVLPNVPSRRGAAASSSASPAWITITTPTARPAMVLAAQCSRVPSHPPRRFPFEARPFFVGCLWLISPFRANYSFLSGFAVRNWGRAAEY